MPIKKNETENKSVYPNEKNVKLPIPNKLCLNDSIKLEIGLIKTNVLYLFGIALNGIITVVV